MELTLSVLACAIDSSAWPEACSLMASDLFAGSSDVLQPPRNVSIRSSGRLSLEASRSLLIHPDGIDPDSTNALVGELTESPVVASHLIVRLELIEVVIAEHRGRLVI